MKTRPRELFNVEAEQAVLGALLLSPDDVLQMPEIQALRAADFWLERHRAIWQAIHKLQREGREVDLVALRDELRRLNGGGVEEFAELPDLISATPTWLRAGEHARIVKNWARQREAEAAISRLGGSFGSDGRFDDRLNEAIQHLNAIQAGDDFASWPIRTLADAYAPRDPLTYAIEGLFALPSLSVVYGSPGTFKTLLLLEAALCVAAGQPWLTSLPGQLDATARETVLMPVFWLDFDNGSRRMDERVEALAKARDLDPETVPFYYSCMPTPWLDASSYSSTRSLAKRINDLMAGLVVIDNLGTISGAADENSTEMVQVMGNLRRCAEETGAAVVVIHHQRKSGGIGRPGDALRGHSSIEAALDLALHVEREEKSALATIQSTKARGADVRPFGALWTFERKPGTDGELDTARFWGQEIEDRTSDHAVRETVLEIIEALPGINRGDLIAAALEDLDVGRATVRRIVKELVAEGEISAKTGAHRAMEHYLG